MGFLHRRYIPHTNEDWIFFCQARHVVLIAIVIAKNNIYIQIAFSQCADYKGGTQVAATNNMFDFSGLTYVENGIQMFEIVVNIAHYCYFHGFN